MTQPITIGGFERKFANDSDPWGTFINRSEAKKRDAIRYALGTGKVGRTLELASGNGSNSAMLSRLSQRLISCDGSPTATELTAAQLAPYPHSTALCRSLPGAVPSGVFDRIVAAEILYYFSLRDMNKLAKTLLHTLRPGGQLILAHHHLKFDDASQPPDGVHDRFIKALPFPVARRHRQRTSRWIVERYIRAKSWTTLSRH